MAVAAALAEAPQSLEPLWTWQPSEGVEWVAQASVGGSELLAVTCAGSVHLLSLASGAEVLPQPIRARPGLAPVPPALPGCGQMPQLASHSVIDSASADDLAYCFDRFTVLAIRSGTQPGLAWHVGTWCEGLAEPTPPGVDPTRTFQGDPEELCKLLAAGTTPLGVIVARDDGQFGLLNRTDGRVLWQRRVGPMALAQLHVCGEEAALVWRSGPEVQAISTTVRTGQIREYPLLAERPWPLWTALTNDGLILIESQRVIYATPRSARTVFSTPSGANIISASVTLRQKPDAASVALLVFGTADGVLHAITPQDGVERWAVSDLKSRSRSWTWSKLLGDLVVTSAGNSAHIREVESGRLLARHETTGSARQLGAAMAADRVWLLVERTGREGGKFELVGLNWAMAHAATGAPERTHLFFDREGVFLDALWTGRNLVISTRTGVSTYAIP